MRRWLVLMLLLSVCFSLSIPFFGKIAVVKLHGEIGGDVKAEDIVDVLEEIDRNPFYVAVVLDIDSGGGSAVEAHEIVKALDSLGKPKIARIGDMGASGAYWIATACDYIVADELSIVGSVGASSIFYSPQKLAEKLGVEVYEVVYPQNKSFGSLLFNATFLPYAREMVKSAGEYFVRDVLSRRPQTKPYLTGLPYLAKDAPELVDAYGGMKEAIEKAKELSNARHAEVEYIEPRRGLKSVLEEIFSSSWIAVPFSDTKGPLYFLQLSFKLLHKF